MKAFKGFYESLKKRPFRTLRILILAPFFYALAFLTCATLALLDFDIQSCKDLWDDIT